MVPVDPSRLLSLPEGKTLEFKRDLSSPRNLLKTLVAFANTAGGRLVIGVEDETGRALGVAEPLDEEERLCSLVADSIRPRLVPGIDMVTVDGRTLLVVEVYPSNTRPHHLRQEGPENGVYVRLGSSNRRADPALVAELRRGADGVTFDEMPLPDLTAADLDVDAARELFRGVRELDRQGLLTLKLLCRAQGRLVPTKGGVLLVGKERLSHFPDAWAQCSRFLGTEKSEIFDHIELHDHLPKLVDGIMLFLRKHAMRGADRSGVHRRDVWDVPIESLRELVVNALVHADWSQRGAPVRVAWFDDRIEVESPGILMPGMTVEDMKQGVSRIRNPVIARVFRELGLIEQWGSGVRRVFEDARRLGLREPEILEVGMHVRVVLHLEPSPMARETAPRYRVDEPDLASRVLRLLQRRPLGKLALAEGLGGRRPWRWLDVVVARLVAQGALEMTVPDRPRSSRQRYRLTAKGRTMAVEADA